MELVCIWLLYMCPFLIITGPACRCVFRIPQGQLQCSKVAFCHAQTAADTPGYVYSRTLFRDINGVHRADLHALTAGAASVQPLSNEPGSSGDSVLPTPQRIKENAAALAAIADGKWMLRIVCHLDHSVLPASSDKLMHLLFCSFLVVAIATEF